MNKRAVIALLLLLPAPTLGTAAGMLWWPEQPIGKILFLATRIWIVAIPLVWLLFVDRSQLSGSPARNGGFTAAIASGLGIFVVIFFAYAATVRLGALDSAMITDRAAQTGLNRPAFYLGGAVYWIALNSLMEEYVWRWFVFRKFEVLLGGKIAVAASAIGFTAHHIVALAAQFNWPIAALASLGVFIGGATWSWLYLRYRSIWPCYVSHAIADVAIFIIGWRLIFGGG
jgi:membrane protease YdiL (CAAX protease family)